MNQHETRHGAGAATGDTTPARGTARRWGVLGGIILAAGLATQPFVASAATPAAGCPAGTYQSWTETYEPATTSVAIPSLAVTYVWVDSSSGRFLFGDGTPLNDSVIDVVDAIGVPATGAGFCKGTATTTVPETTTTTTTVPETTTSTTTTVPETTTSTTTTVPESTTSTSTTVPGATQNTASSTTTSTTTTTEPQSSPPTTAGTSSTTTTAPAVGNFPPAPLGPASAPPVAQSPSPVPGPTPLATTLPETGSSSAGSLTLATMALGLGLLLIAFARRSA